MFYITTRHSCPNGLIPITTKVNTTKGTSLLTARSRFSKLSARVALHPIQAYGSFHSLARARLHLFIGQGLKNLVMVVGCTGMLAYLSPQLALVSVAVFPPVAGVSMWFGRKMKGQQKGVQAALATSSAVAEEVSFLVSNFSALVIFLGRCLKIFPLHVLHCLSAKLRGRRTSRAKN